MEMRVGHVGIRTWSRSLEGADESTQLYLGSGYEFNFLNLVINGMDQCDQLWEQNVAQMFPNVAKIDATAVFTQSNTFLNSPKSHQCFGLLLQANLLPRIFKIRPIWSHWFGPLG